jgi:hypothetical protein
VAETFAGATAKLIMNFLFLSHNCIEDLILPLILATLYIIFSLN